MRPEQPGQRESTPHPPVGSHVEDPATDRIGVVMGYEGPYAQLRSLTGGREWDADPDEILPVLTRVGPGGIVRVHRLPRR